MNVSMSMTFCPKKKYSTVSGRKAYKSYFKGMIKGVIRVVGRAVKREIKNLSILYLLLLLLLFCKIFPVLKYSLLLFYCVAFGQYLLGH